MEQANHPTKKEKRLTIIREKYLNSSLQMICIVKLCNKSLTLGRDN